MDTQRTAVLQILTSTKDEDLLERLVADLFQQITEGDCSIDDFMYYILNIPLRPFELFTLYLEHNYDRLSQHLTLAELELVRSMMVHKDLKQDNTYTPLFEQIHDTMTKRFPDVERSIDFVYQLNPFERGTIDAFVLGAQMNDNRQAYPKQAQENIDRMDAIFESAPKTTAPLFVYRGIAKVEPNQVQLNRVGQDQVYQSTTLSRSTAYGFSSPTSNYAPAVQVNEQAMKGTVLVIRVAIGTPILVIAEVQDEYPGELEVVLPRHGQYTKVTDDQKQAYDQEAFQYGFYEVNSLCKLYSDSHLLYVDFIANSSSNTNGSSV